MLSRTPLRLTTMTRGIRLSLNGTREAISAIITLLFTHYKKHRLIAVVDTHNIRAVNLLEKLHFRREAHYLQNIFFKGEWGDEYCYALLKEEHLQH